MKNISYLRYLIEFIIIILSFMIFKVLGIKISSFISGKIFSIIGPFFRSKEIIYTNLKNALPQANENEIKNFTKNMWNYYGRIFAEYPFINCFRNNSKNININIIGTEILNELKSKNENVIFVSGHFDNFELMAMNLEKTGINLAAIYRPLNNFFMDKIMVSLRKKYICKKQIKKGRSSVRELVKLFKSGYSIALMIDQRVSEGIKSPFFLKDAYTTTIPGQFVKKYNCRVVPIYIERKFDLNFEMKILEPIKFGKEESIEQITKKLNLELEKLILNNPSQWIWSHNRWK